MGVCSSQVIHCLTRKSLLLNNNNRQYRPWNWIEISQGQSLGDDLRNSLEPYQEQFSTELRRRKGGEEEFDPTSVELIQPKRSNDLFTIMPINMVCFMYELNWNKSYLNIPLESAQSGYNHCQNNSIGFPHNFTPRTKRVETLFKLLNLENLQVVNLRIIGK